MPQESAVQHYKGFIEVASCLASLRQEVAAMSSHLAVLQDDFPALSEACESFTAEAKQHLLRRSQNKQLQSELLHRRDPPWLAAWEHSALFPSWNFMRFLMLPWLERF